MIKIHFQQCLAKIMRSPQIYKDRISIVPKPLLISIVLCAIMLSGCGKKGPLYLPDEPKQQALKTANIDMQQALRLQPTQNRLQQDNS